MTIIKARTDALGAEFLLTAHNCADTFGAAPTDHWFAELPTENIMETFSLSEVNEFVSRLNDDLDRCDNGEGMECETIDAALKHYAASCCNFVQQVQQWGKDVFSGKIEFDPQVEREWKTRGDQLYHRAIEMQTVGQNAESEIPCHILDGQGELAAALWNMYRILYENWVTPRPSVGPAPRLGASITVDEEARKQIESLAPLPPGWKPNHIRQALILRKLRAT